MAECPYITVKIDIGEAAKNILRQHIRERMSDLALIRIAVSNAQEKLDEFAHSCGILDEVRLVSEAEETAVQQ